MTTKNNKAPYFQVVVLTEDITQYLYKSIHNFNALAHQCSINHASWSPSVLTIFRSARKADNQTKLGSDLKLGSFSSGNEYGGDKLFGTTIYNLYTTRCHRYFYKQERIDHMAQLGLALIELNNEVPWLRRLISKPTIQIVINSTFYATGFDMECAIHTIKQKLTNWKVTVIIHS